MVTTTKPEASATAVAEAAKAQEPKTVAENMPSRRVFGSVDEAAEYLTASHGNYADFATTTLAAPGVNAEGEFDPAIYTDDMDVMVATLRRAKEGVKAIVVAPVPKIRVILGTDAETYAAIPEPQRTWLERILHKELNHVAVRPLRDAEDVSTVVDQMPTTLDAYLASSREAGAGIMSAFNDLYKQINATFSARLPVWSKARFIKSDLRRAMESKGFALEYFAALEDYKGESLLVAAIKLGISAAKRKGLDPTIFERWLSTRDAKVFTPGEDEDDDDLLDMDSLTDALLSGEGPESEQTAVAEGEAATPTPTPEPVDPAAAPTE